MKVLYVTLIALQGLMYLVITAITLYFGWMMLFGTWGALTGAPDGFARLGKAVLYFFLYNLGAGVVCVIIQALTGYVGNRVPRTESM